MGKVVATNLLTLLGTLIFLSFGQTQIASAQILGHQIVDDENCYSISLGVFGSPENANNIINNTQSLGFRNVWSEVDNDLTKVYYGKYQTYIEAMIAKQDLESSSNLNGLFIKKVFYFPENSLQENQTTYFNLDVSKAEYMETLSIRNHPQYIALENIYDSGDIQTYKSELGKALPLVGNNDPISGYINVNLGIQAIVEGDY